MTATTLKHKPANPALLRETDQIPQIDMATWNKKSANQIKYFAQKYTKKPQA